MLARSHSFFSKGGNKNERRDCRGHGIHPAWRIENFLRCNEPTATGSCTRSEPFPRKDRYKLYRGWPVLNHVLNLFQDRFRKAAPADFKDEMLKRVQHDFFILRYTPILPFPPQGGRNLNCFVCVGWIG